MQETGFTYTDAAPTWDDYVTRAVLEQCKALGARSVLDVGCGNGALVGALGAAGMTAVGCDVSASGIEQARAAWPQLEFHRIGVSDEPGPLAGRHFDVVLSIEVVEHLYDPAALPRFVRPLVAPGGRFILSTPYHGYLKNLAIALLGKWDRHHGSGWTGGHIKFFSQDTIAQLLNSNGFEVLQVRGAGRAPLLWKSMIVTAAPA